MSLYFFYNCDITDEGIQDFSRIFIQINSLKTLNLNLEEYIFINKRQNLISCGSCWQISETGLQNLNHGLKNLASLETLKLDLSGSNSSKTPTGIKHLSQSLRTLKSLKNLDLNLSGQQVDDEGLRNLCKGLKGWTTLQSLRLKLST